MTTKKGIILAGGRGTRLYPLTIAVSKQMLPLYDKPMVYYPLTTLMLAGIRDVLLISTPRDVSLFKDLLGDGSQFGMEISYAVQDAPRGLPDAFIVGERFANAEPCALVLGDNVFYGARFQSLLAEAAEGGSCVFAYRVKDPSAYGVVEFDSSGRAIGVEEKPRVPKSKYAIVGLYFFDGTASERAKGLMPSARGELEITDLIRSYMDEGRLAVSVMGRGYAWLDTGTNEGMMEAASFIEAIQKRTGTMIGCPEEVAYRQGWIDAETLAEASARMKGSDYGAYLASLADEL